MKRIAFCFSGQPRTWKKCKDSWQYFINCIEKRTGAKVDVFCHMWNFNSPPHAAMRNVDPKNVEGEIIPEEELNDLIRTLAPVKHVIQPMESSLAAAMKIHILTQKHNPLSDGTLLYWSASQFHAIMYSAFLKKQHELENMFNYDACFRMRYDIFFSDEEVGYFMADFLADGLANNTLYSCHTNVCQQWPFFRLGDIFFYANSATFDRTCDFVNWLPDIGRRPFTDKKEIMTETSFYFYVKMFKMENCAIKVDPKIFRSSDYLDRKIALGKPAELGSHELI